MEDFDLQIKKYHSYKGEVGKIAPNLLGWNFDSLAHFKAELIDYLDYYNNRQHQGKAKGLAVCDSQTTSP